MGFDLNQIKQADRDETCTVTIPVEGKDGAKLKLHVDYRPVTPKMVLNKEPFETLASIVSGFRLLDEQGNDLGLEDNGKKAEPTQEFFEAQRADFLMIIVDAVVGDALPQKKA